MTTIDSPSAMMITRPCRSTKCAGRDDEPLGGREIRRHPEQGGRQRPEHPLRRAPRAPPTITSAAAARLKGTIRRIAATSETDVPFTYMAAVHDDHHEIAETER